MHMWPNCFLTILGLYKDNGKEHGNYCLGLGFFGENGKENGNYHNVWVYIGIMEKTMGTIIV